jgi:hypothetical protein
MKKTQKKKYKQKGGNKPIYKYLGTNYKNKYDYDKIKKTNKWKDIKSLYNKFGGDNIDLLQDNNDVFNNYLELIAKEDNRYTTESCKRLKNLTNSKRKLLLDPLVKLHIKQCAKFNVIRNFFTIVKAENIIKDDQYLLSYIRSIINFNTEEANDDGIDTINNHSISDVILSSGYYSDFTLEERRELFMAISDFIISRDLHIEKYSKILLSLLSIYDTRGENQFKIRVMYLLNNIENNLRSINTSKDTVDKIIIKFIQSLNWNNIIEYY